MLHATAQRVGGESAGGAENGDAAAAVARCPSDHGRLCPVVPVGAFTDRSGLVGRVGVARCPRCGMGVSQPALSDVAFLYADRSSQDFQPNTGTLARLIKSFAFRRDARRLLAALGPEPAPVCVVDYACGAGLFTRCLAESLPAEARVVGADFHDNPPRDLGGVEYRPFSDLGDLAGKADLLLAMHVVEHDDDPHTLLARMLRLSRPGGYVVVEVPHIDCAWAPVFGRFWDSWYLPYHRRHFSRSSFRALLEASGLSILREIDVSIPTMGRSIANLAGRRNSTGFILLAALLQPLQWSVERLTRRPTALRVIARKL